MNYEDEQHQQFKLNNNEHRNNAACTSDNDSAAENGVKKIIVTAELENFNSHNKKELYDDCYENDDDNETISTTITSSSDSDDDDDDDDDDKQIDKIKEQVLVNNNPQEQQVQQVLNPIVPYGDSNIEELKIENSSKVHVGNVITTVYQGPVTIIHSNSTSLIDNNTYSVGDRNSEIELEEVDKNKENKTEFAIEEKELPTASSRIHPFIRRKVNAFTDIKWMRPWSVKVVIATVLLTIITVLCIELMLATTPKITDDELIVTREEWGACEPIIPPQKFQILPLPYAIISQASTNFCFDKNDCIKAVQCIGYTERIAHGDIAWNFLIGGDGRAYEGRGWDIEGDHTENYNNKSIGIAFIGDFSVEEPTKVQLDAALRLLTIGKKDNKLAIDYKLLGARQVAHTQNPGYSIYNIIKTWEHWSSSP